MTYVRSDNTAEVLAALDAAIKRGLEEAGQIVENDAARRSPVDTGRLRNSITHRMAGDRKVEIGSDVEYAAYVECGTSRSRAQAYLKPAATENAAKIVAAMRDALS